MKKTSKIVSILVLAGAFVFASCVKKEDIVPETPVTTGGTTTGGASATPITPQIGDADGVLIASKTNVTQTVAGFSINIVMGSAIATLYSATAGTTFVDGGTIKTNDSTHVKQSNNSYLFTPKSATGISYSSNSIWSVSGNSSSSVPAFTYTANGFPSTPAVSGTVTSISKGSNFTLTTGSISNADSICFQITSSNKSIYKIKAGNQTSHTFTSAELGTLDNTSYGFISITAYKFNNTTTGGKKYYFINLNTSNKSVSIAN